MLISELIAKLALIIGEEGDLPVVVVAPGWEGDTVEEDPEVETNKADAWQRGRPRRAVISGTR